MKKFLILYKASEDAMAQTASATPEQQAKGIEAWMQWAKKTGAQLVEMGSPLTSARQLGPNGKTITVKNPIVGYSILEAANMDGAIALLNGHPHVSGWSAGATIEIHESRALPGMG